MKPDLDAIQARCEAATPGPWYASDGYESWRVLSECSEDERGRPRIVFDDGSAYGEYGAKCRIADRDFLMAARTDVPALLAYIDELESRTTYAAGETEWANRIAHAEARFVEEYDARKAAERQVEELRSRIVTLEAMKP